MSELTRGTQVAAIEASRNEAFVRAEGSLLGERRNAIARLAMIAMFAIVTQVGGHTDRAQFLVGFAYTLFAVGTLVAVRRVKVATPGGSTWRPAILAVVDIVFTTALGYLDMRRGDPFGPGQHAIAVSILILFSVRAA